MPSTSPSLLSYLRMVVGVWRDDPRDDAELLARFAEFRDEAAFATLVWRHGALVWRTCRHILSDTPDAEDAFQTTFLALARKAGRFPVESLAGWLHRVARQAALDARTGTRRRRGLEQRLQAIRQPEAEAGDADRVELYAALDEELVGLPEQLRVPLMLRYLEGKTLEDVSRIVGCSRRDLGRRLARGEAILRERLERRGLAVDVVSVGALLGSTVTVSALPARLIGSTARAAVALRSGTLIGGAAEAARAVLGALPASIERTIMRKSLWILLACICSLGVGLAAWQALSAYSEAVEAPESAVSPNAAAEPGNGKVDRFGDLLPQGALARLGTVRLRHAGLVGGENEEAVSVVFSRDGKMLLTAGPTNPIRVWEAATGKLLRSFGESHRNGDNSERRARFIVLSPDENILAARNDDDGSVSLWEFATGKFLCPLQGGNDIFALAFSRDGRTILSAGRDNQLRVWEVATGKEVKEQQQPLLNAAKAGYPLPYAFSPDGKTLASRGTIPARKGQREDINFVCLWEAATGKELRHLSVGKGKIPLSRGVLQGAVAFSGDSRFLAVITKKRDNNPSDGTVHLWEAATGKEVRQWAPDKTGTYSVAFSPNGKILATGSGFGPIRLWDTATGKELRQCQDYRAHVVALAFSPDGSTLASLAGLDDHTARLWEVASGKERVRASRGHVGPIVSVAFSPDGKSVISGGRDGLVGLWNAETGQEQCPSLRAGDFQALAALSSDGKTILSAGNSFRTAETAYDFFLAMPSLFCVWDRITGQKLRQFQGPVGVPQSLTLSPDGKVLVWTCVNCVYLIEVASGKVMQRFTENILGSKCAAFSPDGKTLAVHRRGTIHFHETATGKDLGSIQAHRNDVLCLAFSPDGQTLAAGGKEGTVEEEDAKVRNADTIRLWRVHRGKKNYWKEVGKFAGYRDQVWCLTFSADGKTLASASKDGTLRLWEVATGKERRRFAGHGGNVWCLAFAPAGRRLAAGRDDTTILVWDVTGRLQDGQLRPVKLSAQEVKSLWADLTGVNAVRAGQAVWTLAAAPAQALPFLKEHLRPVAPAGPRILRLRIARLIADLDSETYAGRQKATDELAKLGEDAEPALRQALDKPASLEMRRRLEQLLEPLKYNGFRISNEQVCFCRALEVLGQIGTPEALTLLEALAQGAPEARQTLEAQAVLKCLRTRANAAKP